MGYFIILLRGESVVEKWQTILYFHVSWQNSHTHMHEQSTNHIPPKKIGLDVTQSH